LLYAGALLDGVGVVGLSLAVVGCGLLAWRRPAAATVLLAYPVAYLLFMFNVKLFFVRFADVVVPFVALLSAAGVTELAGRAPSGGYRLAALLLSVAVLAQPFWDDLQHQRLLATPDTRPLAYSWLERNLPPGSRIVVDEYSVRDRRPRADLPDRSRFDLDIVNALSEHELGWYHKRGYQYAVVSSFQYQRFPGRFDTYAGLEREARQLAVFSPTADGSELPFDIEDLYSPFHQLHRYQRPGPTVRIYALDKS
jgi:hypothetical protein